MTQEIEHKFLKDFPDLFKDMYGDPKQTLLYYGMECGDGWQYLLYDLCQQIDTYLKGLTKDSQTELAVTITQIKEKYGSLRFYYHGGDEYISSLVDKAERKSEKTCEECGKRGISSLGGWMSVRCKNHWHSIPDYEDTVRIIKEEKLKKKLNNQIKKVVDG